MKKLYALILQLAAFPLVCFSQVEMRDSLSIGHKQPDSISFQTLVKPDSVGFFIDRDIIIHTVQV